MAPPPPTATTTTTTTSHIPTAADVTTAGGIWAPTSAKRDKIAELKTALAEIVKQKSTTTSTGGGGGVAHHHDHHHHPFAWTLDDLATPVQALDLHLCDGLHAIAATVDAAAPLDVHDNTNDKDNNNNCAAPPFYAEPLKRWMMDLYKEKTTAATLAGNNHSGDMMTQHAYEDYLRRFLREMERHLAAQQANDGSGNMLARMRDYVSVGDLVEQLQQAPSWQTLSSPPPPQFNNIVQRYRLLLAQAAAQVLLEKDVYKRITTIHNHDIDRAAVQGIPVDEEAAARIPIAKVEALLESYLYGNAKTRVEAWWNLMDRDNDGLLEQDEMNTVCDLTIRPVGKALQELMHQALEAHPVLQKPILPQDNSTNGNTENNSADTTPAPMGWRQRRQEAQHKRKLQKMFAKTIKNHFVMEVEMAHRLRCIYAWANKAHQDGAVQSVLVDEIAWTGRKRYVELPPKIALDEFRQVQQEHFTHLDRVAAEYVKSFREDLWILQGNGRQRAELYRDSALFMAVVCGIDYMIITL